LELNFSTAIYAIKIHTNLPLIAFYWLVWHSITLFAFSSLSQLVRKYIDSDFAELKCAISKFQGSDRFFAGRKTLSAIFAQN
jgi:hypothetical protein